MSRRGNKIKKNEMCRSRRKNGFKRIFPHFWLESAVVLCVLSVLGIAGGAFSTATLGQEMTLMNSVSSSIINERPSDWDQQEIEFELNAVDDEVETQTIEYATSQMCFIGDSRMVGLSKVVTDAKFIAEGSMGLQWFNDTATTKFEKLKDDIEIVIVALGINDRNNVDNYIARLNEFADQYNDKTCVYVNIGPVSDSVNAISDTALETFNKKMEQGLSDRWEILDQYQYLKTEGFTAYDGIHYSNNDNAKILTWIINSVKTQTITVAN